MYNDLPHIYTWQGFRDVGPVNRLCYKSCWIILKLTILLSDKNKFLLFLGLSFCLIDHNFVTETSVRFSVCIVMVKSHTKETVLFKKSTITDPKNEFLDDKVLTMTS